MRFCFALTLSSVKAVDAFEDDGEGLEEHVEDCVGKGQI